jgi:hypothetical protein
MGLKTDSMVPVPMVTCWANNPELNKHKTRLMQRKDFVMMLFLITVKIGNYDRMGKLSKNRLN